PAVPLDELERRHVARNLDRGVLGQDILQKTDPGLADAGLTVRQAAEMGPGHLRERAEHGFGIGQRDAADEMHDRLLIRARHRHLRDLSPGDRSGWPYRRTERFFRWRNSPGRCV